MAIVEGWMPPSRENWELIQLLFQFFPLISSFQWLTSWYGMGKTSTKSVLNLPGKIGWFTMEVPGLLILLYMLFTLPGELGIAPLPFENRLMAALFVIHYVYRAILFPLAAPSMSPLHVLVWLVGVLFQLFNAVSIGGYLAGYGPTTKEDWSNHSASYIASARMEAGLMIWAIGFILVIFHDDELREIRRAVLRRQKKDASAQGMPRSDVGKVYVVPKNGFFRAILFPHYVSEWMEWSGYWLMGGPNFIPGRTFVINEISTMFPRALQGKRWYIETFGEEKLEGRKAIIPWVI